MTIAVDWDVKNQTKPKVYKGLREWVYLFLPAASVFGWCGWFWLLVKSFADAEN